MAAATPIQSEPGGTPPAGRPRPETIIAPRGPGVWQPAREAWAQRWLIPYFGHMLLEKLYIRTWLGWLWLPLRPAIDLALRVAVIGTLLGSPSPGVPYLLYALVGLTVWQLFEITTIWTTRSLEICRRVVTRIHVSRLSAVLGGVWPGMLYFGIYAGTGVIAVAYFLIVDGTTHLDLGVRSLLFLVAVALAALLALGIGLFTAIVAAQARDVRFALAYFTGFWFFLPPVLYPLDTVSGALHTAATVNPMSAPVELAKYALLGTELPSMPTMISCLATVALLWTAGMWFFNRSEATAVDRM